jgi:hypothetical protein
MKRFCRHRLYFLACCLFWMSSIQADPSIDLVASLQEGYSESADQVYGWSKREIRATLNPEALNLLATGKRVSSLRVLLFPGVVFDLQGIKSDVRLVGTVVNEFSIIGDERGSAVLSVTDGVLYGTVTTGANVVYRIQWEAKDVYRIEELDQSKFPECANPSGSGKSSSLEVPTNSSAIAPSTDTVASEDDGTLVKVLVAYTQAAETAAGGASSISSLIATAESETNTGYSTSGINFLIDVVNTTKVTYNEVTGYSAALNAITNTSDGLMDSVHGLRDTYSADLVVLIIDNSDFCGIAWKPSTVSSSNASSGFSVVGWNCATGYYSFAHEMGHNMGAGHDTYVDSSTLPYAYGHGFVNTSARVRSIMAYNDLCVDSGFNCTRVNHWSATDRLYNGSTVIGDASATNNVALNNSAYSISNYRSSTPAPLPEPPTEVDASDGTHTDKIVVSWSSVAEATTYNVYYSSSLGGSQTLLGNYAGTSINVTGTAPGVVWYFWVYSVNANGESETGTYDTGYVQSENQADLAMQSIEVPPGTYAPGDPISMSNVTQNIGGQTSTTYRITFYASTDTICSNADNEIGYIDRSALAAGATHSYTSNGNLPGGLPDGNYYICAELTVSDTNAGNNTNYDATPITIESTDTSLTITKVINSAQGGTAILNDFDVAVDAVEVAWNDPNSLSGGTKLVASSTGTYTLSEIDIDGYDEGTWSCSDADGPVSVSNGGLFSGADVTVDGGKEVTCSITNTGNFCNVKVVSGTTEYFDATHEACEILALGPDFIAAGGANVSANSGWEIEFLPGFTVEQGATLKANVCGQSLCLTSPDPMPYGCHSCVDQICDIDATCCDTDFDQECLDKVYSVCNLVCE